jgi:hypothetical protein
VYKGRTSLRMIGASKAEKCSCRKAKGKECELCLGRFNYHINTGRPYAMLFCTDKHGRRDIAQEQEYKKNYYALVVDTKIRSSKTETSSDFELPEGAPRHGTSKDTRTNKHFQEEREKAAARHENLSYDSPEQACLQELFKTHPKYSLTVVSSVMRSLGKTTTFIVNVSGHNSTFCQNVNRCHKSNRVWFHVSQAGISQRCYDNAEVADAEMRYGLCKNYKSACFDLDARTQALLFPVEAQENASVLSSITDNFNSATDIKMRSLLDSGNKLCKFLYGTDWTSSKRFHALHGEKLVEIQKTMLSCDRDAIGVRIGAYRLFHGALGSKNAEDVSQSLGFATAGKKRARILSSLEDELESMPGVDSLLTIARNTVSLIAGVVINLDEVAALTKLREARASGNFLCLGRKTRALQREEFKLIEF